MEVIRTQVYPGGLTHTLTNKHRVKGTKNSLFFTESHGLLKFLFFWEEGVGGLGRELDELSALLFFYQNYVRIFLHPFLVVCVFF